ncbi:hypothetical protein GGQ74_001289 [Desulfobaculum xiamenense]|uniref:Hpr(Ser) kinase/phosphatase n=1 Tax=Desulfobaculum xiamenense TaxID=995050 RepID=A0A846QSM0_9BACT|nr:hypothetical protein [Desulfobaculum xiamenense]NJB67649.1 hypothetical protein [Desulfobaculum xiamenense]
MIINACADDLCLDFHGIVTVRAAGSTPDVRKALKRAYAPFLREPLQCAESIRIRPFVSQELPPSAFAIPKAQDHFFAITHGSDALVVFPRYGRPDVVIRLSDPMEILHANRPGCASRVLDALYMTIQLALLPRGGTLFKGAATLRDGQCAVLTGVSGAGKTSLLLGLLRDGWDYLSDNTFILHDGVAHLFRSYAVYNIHHLTHMPWVFEHAAAQAVNVPLRRLRSLLHGLLLRCMPPAITRSHKVRRVTDPYLTAEPHQLFPDCKIHQRARPSLWVILSHADHYAFRPLDREEAIVRMEAIQALTHPDREALTHQLGLLGRRREAGCAPVLPANLTGEFRLAELPRNVPIRELHARIGNDIATVLHAHPAPEATTP